MKKILLINLLFAIVFSSCQTEDDPDPRDPLYPLKVDRRAVGNFETSKFDGVWQVIYNKPSMPILDYTRVMYIFKNNTVHEFVSSKNWSNYDSDEEFTIRGWGANEFMYSDKVIYTYIFRNYWAWGKSSYDLSLDGKKLTFGGLELEKMDIKPWAKEDLIGTWYQDYGYNAKGDYTMVIYTFTEDSLTIKIYVNGRTDDSYANRYITFTLTDEAFTGRFNLKGYYAEQHESTCYYHIIDNKVYLSNGYVLTRYENSDEGL